MQPIPTTGRAYSMILQERKQQEGYFKRSHDSEFLEQEVWSKYFKQLKEELNCNHYNRNNNTVDKCF